LAPWHRGDLRRGRFAARPADRRNCFLHPWPVCQGRAQHAPEISSAGAVIMTCSLMLVTGIMSVLRSAHRMTTLSAILPVAVIIGVLDAMGVVFPKLESAQ